MDAALHRDSVTIDVLRFARDLCEGKESDEDIKRIAYEIVRSGMDTLKLLAKVDAETLSSNYKLADETAKCVHEICLGFQNRKVRKKTTRLNCELEVALMKRRDQHRVTVRSQQHLFAVAGALSLCGVGIIVCAAINLNQDDVLSGIWLFLGVLMTVGNCLAVAGSERVRKDVQHETNKVVPIVSAFGYDDPKATDGLETTGQQLVESSMAVNMFSITIHSILSGVSNTASKEEIAMIAIGFAAIPLYIYSFYLSTVIVSVYETLQGMSYVFIMLTTLVCSIRLGLDIWVINTVMTLHHVFDHVIITVPAVILTMDIGLITNMIFAFLAVYRESRLMLRNAMLSIAIFAIPLTIVQSIYLSTFNYQELIQSKCRTIVNLLDESFFLSAFSCLKYIGKGRVKDEYGIVNIVDGPGETIFCGYESEDKQLGTFAWERNPVFRQYDLKQVDYYGCLNLNCCEGLVDGFSRIHGVFVTLNILLVLIAFAILCILKYLQNHLPDGSNKIVVQVSKQKEEEDILNEQAVAMAMGDIYSVLFNAKRRPFLKSTGLFLLVLILTSVLVIYYGNAQIRRIEDYSAYVNYVSSEPLACTDNCDIGSMCTSTAGDCCINGVLDVSESDVDCGASCGKGFLCEHEAQCQVDTDCISGCCEQNKCDDICSNPSCTNGIQDGFESCVDGGGAECRTVICELFDQCTTQHCEVVGSLCGEGQSCFLDADCIEGFECLSTTCVKSQSRKSAQELLGVVPSRNDVLSKSSHPKRIGMSCENDEQCISRTCSEPRCSSEQAPCIFPFLFKGILSFSCRDGDIDPPAPDWDSNGGHLWCSTTFDFDTDSQWGHCNCSIQTGVNICTVPDISLFDETECLNSCSSVCSIFGYPLCASGSICNTNDDCDSGICFNSSSCVSCNDGIKNGFETDIDCGGMHCGVCQDGNTCLDDKNCHETCHESLCTSCSDGLQNGDETCVDGGGIVCPLACSPGDTCLTASDCDWQLGEPASCVNGKCAGPQDGAKNVDETDIDCGGGKVNPKCQVGQNCDNGEDCLTGICTNNHCSVSSSTLISACNNSMQDYGEECIDAAGACREWNHLCSVGSFVSNGDACETGYMNSSRQCSWTTFKKPDILIESATEESCNDGFKNGFESDIDCGGFDCFHKCTPSQRCNSNFDCQSGFCDNQTCSRVPTEAIIETCIFSNNLRDTWESDVDCGGLCSYAGKSCRDGKTCIQDRDCDSFHCVDEICVSCSNGIVDGGETDVDCGGASCPRCSSEQLCNNHSDCADGTCHLNICASCTDDCSGKLGVDFEGTLIAQQHGLCTRLNSQVASLVAIPYDSPLCPAPKECSSMKMSLKVPPGLMVLFSQGIIDVDESLEENVSVSGSLNTVQRALSSVQFCWARNSIPRTNEYQVVVELVSYDPRCHVETCQQALMFSTTFSDNYIFQGRVVNQGPLFRPASGVQVSISVSNYCYGTNSSCTYKVPTVLTLQNGQFLVSSNVSQVLSRNSIVHVSYISAEGTWVHPPVVLKHQQSTIIVLQEMVIGHVKTTELTLEPTISNAPTKTPSISAPTTSNPTTESPNTSTEAPTTSNPTTESPNTSTPTEAPTTSSSSPNTSTPTEAPTTSTPTTESPSISTPTEAPTTSNPTTESPNTSTPTEAPTTSTPTTESPNSSTPTEVPNTPTFNPGTSLNPTASNPTTSTPTTSSPSTSSTPSISVFEPTSAPSTKSPTSATLNPTSYPSYAPSASPSTASPTLSPLESIVLKVIDYRESFCGEKNNYTSNVSTYIISNSRGDTLQCSTSEVCHLGSEAGNFFVTLHSTRFSVYCSSFGCACESEFCTSEDHGVIFWGKSPLADDGLRICLDWKDAMMDFNMYLTFKVSEENYCAVSVYRTECGNASSSADSKAIHISNVYQTVYALSIENYWENSGTAFGGAQVELDGMGISQRFNTAPDERRYYESWIQPGAGEYREESKFFRVLCIDARDGAVNVYYVPKYSSWLGDPLESCLEASREIATLSLAGSTDGVKRRLGVVGGIGRTATPTAPPRIILDPIDRNELISGRVVETKFSVNETSTPIMPRRGPFCFESTDFTSAENVCALAGGHVCSEKENQCDTKVVTSDLCLKNNTIGHKLANNPCVHDGCQASYVGERCWHDGSKPKSCKSTWEAAGLFNNTAGIPTFINTLEHCDMCADDEDCKLFTYVGYYPGTPVQSYDYCELGACVEISPGKIPGLCLSDGTNCGDTNEFTVEDGTCFQSPPHDSCSCSNSATHCVVIDEVYNYGCCWNQPIHSLVHQLPVLYNHPGMSTYGDEVYIRAHVINYSSSVTRIIVTDELPASPSFSDCSSLSLVQPVVVVGNDLMLQIPNSPGTFQVCALTKESHGDPVCTLETNQVMAAEACVAIEIVCPFGLRGKDCSTVTPTDTDADGTLDFYDECPFDSKRSTKSDNEGCFPLQGQSTLNTTVSGRACQNWSKQMPHRHNTMITNLGNHNYCRNPDDAPGGTWCFTTDTLVRWEYCESNGDTTNSQETIALLHQADGILIRSTDENAFSAVGVSSVHDMVAISNLKTEASPPSFIHLGCQSSRFFSKSVQVPFYFTKTPSDCVYRCSFLGYSFFTIQTGGEICRCLPAIVDECVESDPVEKGCFTSTTSGRDEQCLYPVVYKDIVLLPGNCIRHPDVLGGFDACFTPQLELSRCTCVCDSFCDGLPCGGTGTASGSVYSIESYPDIYVSNNVLRSVVTFYSNFIPTTRSIHSTDIEKPGALAVFKGNQLCVADLVTGNIVMFTQHGTKIQTIHPIVKYDVSSSILIATDAFNVYTLYGGSQLQICTITHSSHECLVIAGIDFGASPRRLLSMASSNFLMVVSSTGQLFLYDYTEQLAYETRFTKGIVDISVTSNDRFILLFNDGISIVFNETESEQKWDISNCTKMIYFSTANYF